MPLTRRSLFSIAALPIAAPATLLSCCPDSSRFSRLGQFLVIPSKVCERVKTGKLRQLSYLNPVVCGYCLCQTWQACKGNECKISIIPEIALTTKHRLDRDSSDEYAVMHHLIGKLIIRAIPEIEKCVYYLHCL